jgi:NADH-quinone oxidoreductase subunit L
MAHAFVHGYYHLYLLAAVGAFLTSFYMFRLTYLTFYGSSRVDPHVAHHIHESPSVMTVPLIILAGLALLGGFLGVPPEHGWFHGFLHEVATPLGAEPHEVGWGLLFGLMGVAIAIALGGWGLAHYMYAIRPQMAGEWAAKSPQVYTTILNKYYVDEAYDFLIVEPFKKLGMIWDWVDQRIIDRFIVGIGRGTDVSASAITWVEKYVIYAGLNVVGYSNHLLSWSWRKLQSGMVHHYAAIIIIGLALLIHLVLVWFVGSSAARMSIR